MQMTLVEFEEFSNIRHLRAQIPAGVKANLHFNSIQRHGSAHEGPWISCWIDCWGFKTETEARSVWSYIEKRFGIGANSTAPHEVVQGERWGFRALLERQNVVQMNEEPQGA